MFGNRTSFNLPMKLYSIGTIICRPRRTSWLARSDNHSLTPLSVRYLSPIVYYSMPQSHQMQERTGEIALWIGGLRCWGTHGAVVCPVCGGSGMVASPSWRNSARKGGVKSYIISLQQGRLSMKERGKLGGRPRALLLKA